MFLYECILSLIAGVGVFILAMKLLSYSLNQIAGNSMKNILEKLTGNSIKGVLVGALVTAVVQSSSATTVMVIGFVNAEIMDLNQATAIIIGSNIGTTITGLLASLESLNISLYLSLLVFIGVMLSLVEKLKKISLLLMGLGMIFVGLKMMSSACDDESIKKSFSNILEKLDFPLFLEFLGVIFTAIIQSSSAMTGIIIVMVGKKVMSMRNGLFITLGANVGTCITALISIIGANINSKRTALIHFIFNISGCILFTPILWIFSDNIIFLLEKLSSEDSIKIAYFHLFFNITTACLMTPLINYLVKFVKNIIKDEDSKAENNRDIFVKDKEGYFKIRPSSNSIDITISNDFTSNDKQTNENNTDDDESFIKGLKNRKQIKKELKKNEKLNSSNKENDVNIININSLNTKINKKKEEKIDNTILKKNINEEEKQKLNE